MPLYEYECRRHGVFEQLGSVADRASPRPCPNCARPAIRVLSATQQPALERSALVAHARNERSRHEPRMVTRQTPAAASTRDSPPAPKPQHPHGGGRPWMIGH